MRADRALHADAGWAMIGASFTRKSWQCDDKESRKMPWGRVEIKGMSWCREGMCVADAKVKARRLAYP